MKTKILLVLALLALSTSLIAAATAITPVDTNTYTITKTSPGGPSDPVNLGATVTMTAATSNDKVNTVIFTWYAPGNYPSGPYALNETDYTPSDGFTSSLTVDHQGEWTVVATFERTIVDGNSLKPIWEHPITKQVSVSGNFFVVPEYPLIGAAGASASIGLALLVFKRKQLSNLI